MRMATGETGELGAGPLMLSIVDIIRNLDFVLRETQLLKSFKQESILIIFMFQKYHFGCCMKHSLDSANSEYQERRQRAVEGIQARNKVSIMNGFDILQMKPQNFMTDWILGVKDKLELRRKPLRLLARATGWVCYHPLIWRIKKRSILGICNITFHFVHIVCEILLILVMLMRMSPLQLLCLRKVQKMQVSL